jgi:hypothetical protein
VTTSWACRAAPSSVAGIYNSSVSYTQDARTKSDKQENWMIRLGLWLMGCALCVTPVAADEDMYDGPMAVKPSP